MVHHETYLGVNFMLPCVNDFINLARNAATALHHAKCFHNTVSVCLSVYLYVNNAVAHPPEAHQRHSCLNSISLNEIIFARMQVDL